jgi:AbrB family looped-hinge helix DNA binding protein
VNETLPLLIERFNDPAVMVRAAVVEALTYSGSATANVYVQAVPESVRETVEKMDRALRKKAKAATQKAWPLTPVCYPTDGSPDSGLPESIVMNTTAKIQHKGQVTIPTSVRRQAGLSKGDLVNFAFRRGQIVITPRMVIDRSQFPNADDEYTPAQRRIIDARLDESEEQLKNGLGYGPFDTAEEMIAHMKGQLKQRAAAKKTRRAR